MRHLLTTLSALYVCIPASVLAQEQSLRFGITEAFGSPACAIFADAELQPGQPLFFIAFDPQRRVSGRIIQKRTQVCREESILEGIAYDVQLDLPEGEFLGLGVSVVGPESTTVTSDGEQLSLVSSAGGEVITFRRCSSNEGLHFSASRDQARFWHEYYYVPYDLEPTCAESDFDYVER